MGASCLEDWGVNLTPRQELPMTNDAMSPLRRRMIEDMTIRNFGPKTDHDIRSIKNLYLEI
jgi:hypothetical protein